jgi:Protein of unknown function (DUF1214)
MSFSAPHRKRTGIRASARPAQLARVGGPQGGAYRPESSSPGQQLTGEHMYAVTFEPTSLADTFWSLTVHDVLNYYLVDNRIDRYSVATNTWNGHRRRRLRNNHCGGSTCRI